MFRESFWDTMSKYALPKKKSGIFDKATAVGLYKEKTEELKRDFNQNNDNNNKSL